MLLAHVLKEFQQSAGEGSFVPVPFRACAHFRPSKGLSGYRANELDLLGHLEGFGHSDLVEFECEDLAHSRFGKVCCVV